MPKWAADHARQISTKASINAMLGLVLVGVSGSLLIAHAEVVALERMLCKLELKHEQNLRALEAGVAENSAAIVVLAADLASIKGEVLALHLFLSSLT